jgi:hypothetical protein
MYESASKTVSLKHPTDPPSCYTQGGTRNLGRLRSVIRYISAFLVTISYDLLSSLTTDYEDAFTGTSGPRWGLGSTKSRVWLPDGLRHSLQSHRSRLRKTTHYISTSTCDCALLCSSRPQNFPPTPIQNIDTSHDSHLRYRHVDLFGSLVSP